MSISIRDEASPLLQMMIDKYPDATRGALKSVGYWAMKQIQGGISSQAPGGEQYAKFYPQPLRRALDQILDGRGKSNYPPLGKLQRAIKYNYLNSNSRGMTVVVGWTSGSSINLGEKQQEGFSRPMTEAMRRAFDASFAKLGLKIRIAKSTTQISTPARPTISPMSGIIDAQAPAKFEGLFKQYILSGPVTRSASGNKRQYKVLKEF